MISKDIKGIKKDSGFTIVELLVVIVVIGILAAITIISYTGVTARAKTTQAQTNAQSARNVADIYNADNGSYPPTAATFSDAGLTTKLPSNMFVVPGIGGTAGAFTGAPVSVATLWGTTITSANFPSTVTWTCSPTCTSPTGGRITYYDFSTGLQSTNYVYVGTASSSSDFAAPAS